MKSFIIGLGDEMSVDYKITFHRNMYEPIVYIKNRFMAARQLVEKLMMGLEPSEKIIIERGKLDYRRREK